MPDSGARAWRSGVGAGLAAGLGAALALALLAGCGSSSSATKAADDDGGTYTVRVARATLPARQRLADHEQLVIAVRNAGEGTVPNVAVSVGVDGRGTSEESFGAPSPDSDEVASRSRPVWTLDGEPQAGKIAGPNTWALGPLKPGATKTFRWPLTAVKPGRHTVDYRVYASLSGDDEARLPGGGVPRGKIGVTISSGAVRATVNGAGQVVTSP